MFTKDDLWRFKSISIDQFPQSKFLIMFLGVIITPLALIVAGTRNSNIHSQLGMPWYFLAIILFLLAGMSMGFIMFRSQPNATKGLSISSKAG